MYSSTIVGYLICAIPVDWLIENRGIRYTLIIASLFILIGIWMRILIDYSIWFVILGNFIASFGRSSAIHAPPKVAIKWFFPKNTPFVTSILLLGSPVGNSIGMLLTNFLVTTKGNYTVE